MSPRSPVPHQAALAGHLGLLVAQLAGRSPFTDLAPTLSGGTGAAELSELVTMASGRS
jgi:hypothetical protein